MARPNQDAINTFVSITGTSEAVALQKLEEHGGDLNEAVNAYFSEGDRTNTQPTSVHVPQNDFMDIDDPIQVAPHDPFSFLAAARNLNPFSILDSSFHRSFFDGRGTADVANRAPWVLHPREVREIPIEFKDGSDPSGQSGSRPIVEDVTGSTHAHGPEVHGTVITNDEDEEDIPVAPHSAPSAPQPHNVTDYGDDIEEEMLKAAIEASKRDAEEGHSNHQFGAHIDTSGSRLEHRSDLSENVELARAVSLSLKTAEREKAMRDRKGVSDSSSMDDLGRRLAPNGRCFTSGASETAKGGGEMVDSQPSSSEPHDIGSRPHDNGGAFHSEEWGGISSQEQDEAVMLEAALFGGIPQGPAYHFAYPLQPPQTGSDGNRGFYPQWVPRSPSPTLAAQRLLREQQDDEYLAALEADKEKEIKARGETEIRRLQEAAAKEAALQDQKHQEEAAHRKMLEEEEFERLLATKQASLPQEPALDDENAVTLLVRMPDGSRHGRRFLKSDRLQSLFDFIDIHRGVKPGTYKLVRPYPRRAFGDGESELSLSELGLTSKQEALFLELF
ncbi:plant UBX domain-containing protein 8 [Cinnamomum micranthum f. kanehirae]|uniref:Plant UBX domain-containing protein 8 n=1 Tax=Cinnamomum micranthum f. kanehirae TaxID=337451 RepID=A0A3S3NKC0_9MAGN|nr:plant UBX domain-containing protein 8 [Cinnamomum micranthum f. kanehirae]